MKQLLTAFLDLYDQVPKIVHRNLSLQSIYVQKFTVGSYKIKLGDFCYTKPIEQK